MINNKMIASQLKSEIKKLGYKGKMPTKKDDLQHLYDSLLEGGKPPSPKTKNMTIAQLKVEIKKLGYKGTLPTKKADVQRVYDSLLAGGGGEQPSPPPPPAPVTMTIAQLKKEIKKLGYKGTLPTKKADVQQVYDSLLAGDVDQPSQPAAATMTIAQLKKEIKKLGYKGTLPTKKADVQRVYDSLLAGGGDGGSSPLAQTKAATTMTIAQLKTEIKKLGHKGALPTKKADLQHVYDSLLERHPSSPLGGS